MPDKSEYIKRKEREIIELSGIVYEIENMKSDNENKIRHLQNANIALERRLSAVKNAVETLERKIMCEEE